MNSAEHLTVPGRLGVGAAAAVQGPLQKTAQTGAPWAAGEGVRGFAEVRACPPSLTPTSGLGEPEVCCWGASQVGDCSCPSVHL